MKKINYFSVIMALFVISLCCGTASYAQDYGDDLIVNGDFSGGNIGFDTDYMYVDPTVTGTQSLQPEGRYTIGVNPRLYHNNFVNMPDNDNPFMIVNGHTTATMNQQGVTNNPAIVWEQVIEDVESGKDYEFSFDLLSLVTSNPAHIEITIYINGDEMQSTFIGEGQTQNWVNYVWTNTDKSTNATITIAETSKVQSGNDFGLDNIMFREILPQYTPLLKVSPVLECVTNNGDDTYTALFGYNNQNEFEVEILQGPDNRISSNTALEGSDDLPEVFLPGRQVGVFEIVFDGANLVWYLNSPDNPAATSTASANSQRCPCEDELEITVEGEMEVCAGEYGSLFVDVMGGVGPYTFVWADGFEGAERTDLPAGEYTVTVMDDNGCEVTETFAVVEFPEMDVVITSTPVTCNGDEDGKIVVEMNGAKPFNICISYGCEPGDKDFTPVKTQTATYEGLMPGNYLITVVDANGCEYTECVTVGEPDVLEASVEVLQNVSCFEGTDGMAELTITGGTEPYTIDFDYDMDALAAGTYTVIVNDANMCGPVEVEFTITEPDALTASVQVIDNVSCFGGNDGSAVLTIGGGTPDYVVDFDYDWNALEAGTYEVIVTDANECGPVVVEFEITQPQDFTASVVVSDNVSCYGLSDGVAVLTIAGGTEPYTVDFGYDFSALAAGDYTVIVNDANECGPIAIDFEITQPDELTFDLAILDHVSCNGLADGAVDLTIAGGTNPFYVFEGDEQFDINALAAGTYTITVDDENGCGPLSETFTITEPDLLTADYVIVNHVSCNGGFDGAVEITIEGGTNPFHDFDGDLNALSAGDYTITVDDENGCGPVVLEFTITEPPLLVATLVSTEDISCFGAADGEAVISVTGGTPPYTFDLEGVFADGLFTMSDLNAGSYTVSISDAKNCGPETVTFEIEEPAELIIDNVDVIIPDCAPENFPGCEEPWAVAVIEDMTIAGVKANGGAVDADRRVLTNVLGMPVYESTGPPITYVSLGFGGEIVLEAGCEIVNGEGDDFEVIETTYAQPNCANYPEKADVWVAQTLDGPWSYLGEVCLGGALDLSNGVDGDGEPFVLDWARYVKIIDVSDPAEFSGNDDGFDLNGIYIFNTPEAPEVVELDITISPEGITPVFVILDSEGNVVEEITEDGSYNIYFTYEGCESNMYPIDVVFPDPIEATAAVTDASCFGEADGSAEISIIGGSAPYTIIFNGEEIEGNIIEGLIAGSYTAVIVDDKGCMETVDFVVEQPEELVIEGVEVTVPECAPDNFPACETPWAVSVVDDMTVEGYATYGNGQVHANRRVIENVLGEPDFTNSPPITYVSLGFGGQLVLEAGCEIVNGEGDDFEVIETSYGQSNCANYPEKADVWVAQTLDGPWSYLGETCLSGAFDLSNGVDDTGASFVLDWARYVKVVDATDPDDFSNGDGFDLNGIHIFNTPSAPEFAALQITITPVVEGAVYTVLNEEGEEVDINNISESGTYTIFFEFEGCFSNEFEFEVVFPEPIVAEAEVSDVSCFEGTDGSAEISITGGTAPYTIIFDGEEVDGNIIAGLGAGSYVAVIVDANGCVETVSFDVEEPTQLVVEQTNGEILCFEGTTTVSLIITGGTAPYVLTDDNSDFSLDITEAGLVELDGFAYGQYNWTVTDANGCYVAVEFFLDQPELLEAEESYEAITCFGGTTDVTVTANGGAEGSYKLYIGEVSEATFVAEFDDFYVVPALGFGSHFYIVVDANGCETEVSFDLEQPEEFTADFELDPEQILCHNGLTDVIVTGMGGTQPYLLNLGDGNVIEFYGSHTVNEIAPGMAYSWTVTDANNCVEIPIEFEIENPEPIVVVSVETEDIPCYGEDNGFINIVAEGGTGALTYALNGGEAQDNGLFENLTAGEYEITITDANGCYFIEYVTLTEPDELVVDLEIEFATGIDMNDGTITGMISGGVGPYNVCLFTYCEYNEDEANEDYDKSQGFMHFGLEPGTYMVVVTDQNGCQWIECVEIGIEQENEVDLISQKDEDPLSDGNFMATEAQVSVYPNPFTTQATIEFSLTENSDVTLEIYNLVGERVAVIYNGHVNAFESHKHTFNAESLPNGIYIYRLTAGEKVFHDRIILTR